MKPHAGFGRGVANGNLALKREIRRRVVSAVPSPEVFECYAGDGKLTQEWLRLGAHTVTGVDAKQWSDGDSPRFVADAERCLRSIDLSAYNVFDVDSWGNPFAALFAIRSLRRWGSGERGAIVWTDGSLVHTMKRGRANYLKKLLSPTILAATYGNVAQDAVALHSAAAQAFVATLAVDVISSWVATFRGAGSGVLMMYGASVFEGQPTSRS